MDARVLADLTSEQKTTLRMRAGSGKTEQRMTLHATVVLLAAEGHTLPILSCPCDPATRNA